MFTDSVGSAVILSIVDMSVVFLVLAFLWLVVFVTRYFVNPPKRKAAKAAGEKLSGPAPGQAPAEGEDEAELVAVKAAALTAFEESRAAGGASVPLPAQGAWKRPTHQSGVKPRWR